MAGRGKTVACWSVGMAVVVVILVSTSARGWIVSEWNLWRFSAASGEGKWNLAERLERLGPKAQSVPEKLVYQSLEGGRSSRAESWRGEAGGTDLSGSSTSSAGDGIRACLARSCRGSRTLTRTDTALRSGPSSSR